MLNFQKGLPVLNAKELKNETIRLNVNDPDFGDLVDIVKNKKIVLIGESTHGSSEFYEMRARITRELIENCGFNAIAVEGDWADIYRIDRYVKGVSDDRNAHESLGNLERFPLWMWRNRVVEKFVSWLESHNRGKDNKVGFYGLDLYGMQNSIGEILRVLKGSFPSQYEKARERYACFQMPLDDAVDYGRAVATQLQSSCEKEAIAQLNSIREKFVEGLSSDSERDVFLNLEQNARVIIGAESYYRNLFNPGVSTWNIRDKHMFETLKSIDEHISESETGKIIVWAHNSHVGRAVSTRRELMEETTLGELAADHYKDMCYSIGMTTCSGSVTAAHNWDEEGRFFNVNAPLENSYENLFSRVGGDFMLPAETLKDLKRPLLERAIGVIYRPETERFSHYFESDLAARYDWIVHINKTSALEPIDDLHVWQPMLSGRERDLYPSSL